MGNAVPEPEILLKYSKFSILNIARGEKTQVVEYIGGASKK